MSKFTVVLFVSCFFVGCTSVQVDSPNDFTVAAGSTYAWAAPLSAENTDLPWAAFQKALDERLVGLGMQLVKEGEPDLLLMVNVSTERKKQNNDPLFTVWVAEIYEEGTLRLEILDPAKEERVWSGQNTVRLRTVSRTAGGFNPKWNETGQERDWQLEKAAERIINELDGR